MRSALVYLNALRRELVAFLMGSTPLALAAGLEHYRGQSIAWPLYGGAVLCGFFVASYRVWAKERRRVLELEAGPRLRLVFDPTRPPYVQKTPRITRFRVGIANDGSRDAENVQARVESIDPAPEHFVPWHALGIMDRGGSCTVPVGPDPSTFIDLAEVHTDAARPNPHPHFQFLSEPLRRACHAGHCTVVVAVQGGGSAARARYCIAPDAAGHPSMVEAGE